MPSTGMLPVHRMNECCPVITLCIKLWPQEARGFGLTEDAKKLKCHVDSMLL